MYFSPNSRSQSLFNKYLNFSFVFSILTEKINVFGLYKHEYYNKQEDFQFKVGLGVKL